MKKLQLKKMKISKIDHINTIMGGFTTGNTNEECIVDLKSKLVKNDDTILEYVCTTQTGTDRRTMSGNTTGLVETDQCDG